MQEFIRITEGYTYPADGGGLINEVTYVENQNKPSVLQYVQSIPTLLLNGTTSLPKPVGADTKVRPCNLESCKTSPAELPCWGKSSC